MHLELDITAREVGGELAGQQVGVRLRDEDREPALGKKLVDDLLEAPDVMELVDEEVLEPFYFKQGLDQALEPVRHLNPHLSRSRKAMRSAGRRLP